MEFFIGCFKCEGVGYVVYICFLREEGKVVKKFFLDLLLIIDKYFNDFFVYFFVEDYIICFCCGGWGYRKYLCFIKRVRKI